jgi:hypothetical protein
LIQSLLTELALQSNRPSNYNYGSGTGDTAGSQVSHMTQDQYIEMNKMQMREEKFYFKFNQEIYKLQEKLKLKLSSIEGERTNVLRRIEALVKQTYSGKISSQSYI